MEPKKILEQFHRNQYSIRNFAEDYGSYPSAVSQVFNGKSTSQIMMRAASTLARYMARVENSATQ